MPGHWLKVYTGGQPYNLVNPSVQDAAAAKNDGINSDRSADVTCVEPAEDVDDTEARLLAIKVRMIS